jgi:hypothetical protein
MSAVTQILKELPTTMRAVEVEIDADLALRRCASEIRRHHDRLLQDGFAIGEQLVKARGLLRGAYQEGRVEGEWLRWLRDDVQMSHMQAARFIRTWERYGRVNSAVNPHPSFTVLSELAAPEADPKVVAQIEQRITRGEKITVRQVVKAKREAKTMTPPTPMKGRKQVTRENVEADIALRLHYIKSKFGIGGLRRVRTLLDKTFPGCGTRTNSTKGKS